MKSEQFSALALFTASAFAAAFDGQVTSATCKPAKPLPAKCGLRGYLNPGDQGGFPQASPSKTSSVEECAAQCAAQSYFPPGSDAYGIYIDGLEVCRGFYYDTKSKFCQLGRFDPLSKKSYVKPNSKSTHHFYGSNCFNCGASCSQPVGTQLLYKGDFENAFFGPWASAYSQLGPGHNSSRAYECGLGYSNSCFLGQGLNICPNSLYSFQFDYLSVYKNTSAGGPKIMAQFGGDADGGDHSYALNIASNNTDTGAWKTMKGYYQGADNFATGPRFFFDGGGDFFIDNVMALSLPTPQTSAQNLIQNGGFESGALKPWTTQDDSLKIVSPGLNSNYALKWAAYTSYQYAYNIGPFFQTVSTTPGKSYLLSFDYVSIQNTFQTLFSFGPDDLLAKTIYFSPGNQTISFPIYATQSSTALKFDFYIPRGQFVDDGIGSITLDNFKLFEITNF